MTLNGKVIAGSLTLGSGYITYLAAMSTYESYDSHNFLPRVLFTGSLLALTGAFAYLYTQQKEVHPNDNYKL